MTIQLSTNPLPKVIFFDAMGTLFGLHTSVGNIYQQFAHQYGVQIDALSLQQAFIESYQAAPPLAFATTNATDITQQEFLWWKNLVQATFERVEVFNNFSNFTDFFGQIYTYFATQEPWYIYPDVVPCLEYWQQQNIELGIISNFDSRLNQLLKALDLESFFTSITISSVAGFAKPDANIFKIALKKHHCEPEQAWHIGDSFKEDYQGAKNTNIQAFWLNRDRDSRNIENQLPNLSSLG